MSDWESLIGFRVLVRLCLSLAYEFVIWNVSPSGNWVELKRPDDLTGNRTYWHKANTLDVVEELENREEI